MGKILTVTVPAYNAEQYIRSCLDSFCIEEIAEDIEVLIINDGSKDSTPDIGKEYQENYPEIFHLINKENGGHGSGINSGIRHASGKYFKVVDADDWVDKEAFLRLINYLKKSDADIVHSGFLWAYDEGQPNVCEFKTKAESKIPFSGVEYDKIYEFDKVSDHLYIKMHDMTIKTSILREHDIKIDEKCFYVDSEYITFPIPYVQTIAFTKGYVYRYRIGRQGQSVSMEKMQQLENNYDRVITSLLSFYDQLGNEILCTDKKKGYIAGIIARVIAAKIKIILSFPGSKEKKTELVEFDTKLKNNYKDIYDCNHNSAIKLLRRTDYKLYRIASAMVCRLSK